MTTYQDGTGGCRRSSPGVDPESLPPLAMAAAAASRARSTADRLAELRVRIDRLQRGEHSTPEDVHRAHEFVHVQAQALAVARDRLTLVHDAAAVRRGEFLGQLAARGRTERDGRGWAAAQRRRDTVAGIVETSTGRGTAEAVIDSPPASGVPSLSLGNEPSDDADEITRLRRGFAALLSWADGANLDEAERRQVWSQSIVEHCASPGWRGWIDAVCRVGAATMPAIRGVAITVVSGSEAELMAASDSWTSRVQEMEFIVGEGPSATAHAENRLVLIEDLAMEREAWQGYAAASSGDEVRGVCGIPLRVQSSCIGAMTLYFRTAMSEVPALDLADVFALAAIAAAVLPADIERVPNGGAAGHELFITHVASGALAVRLNIPVDEAASRLRAYAFSAGQSLAEAARQLLEDEGDIA